MSQESNVIAPASELSKQEKTALKKQEAKKGHLNAAVYASGESGLWGFGASVAAGALAFIGFFIASQKFPNSIGKLAAGIKKNEDRLKEILKNKIIPGQFRAHDAQFAPAVTVALFVSTLAGHFVPLPVFRNAFRRAKAANAAYDNAIAKNNDLQAKNEELTQEVAQLTLQRDAGYNAEHARAGNVQKFGFPGDNPNPGGNSTLPGNGTGEEKQQSGHVAALGDRTAAVTPAAIIAERERSDESPASASLQK